MSSFYRAKLFLPILALLLFQISAQAAEEWTIQSRNLPAPAAASDALSSAIARIPQPNVATSSFSPQTPEQWVAFVNGASAARDVPLATLEQTANVSIEKDVVAGVTVYRVVPNQIAPEHRDDIFFHIHGGAYVLGGGDGAVAEAVQVASSSGIRAISVDYRMPPESPFPAAVDDTIAVYREVLKSFAPGNIAIGGTSTGGGLSFATVLQMKALGLPVPAAIFAGTPWADLSKTSDTLFTNEGIDRVLVTYDGLLKGAAELYAGGENLKHPLISPLYGNFSGFPPTILVSGTRDLLLSDTVRAHRKLRDAGVVAELHVFEGLSHAGYLFDPTAPESVSTFSEISQFFKTHLD